MYIYIFILIGILQHFKITLEMNFGNLPLTTPKSINDIRMHFSGLHPGYPLPSKRVQYSHGSRLMGREKGFSIAVGWLVGFTLAIWAARTALCHSVESLPEV